MGDIAVGAPVSPEIQAVILAHQRRPLVNRRKSDGQPDVVKRSRECCAPSYRRRDSPRSREIVVSGARCKSWSDAWCLLRQARPAIEGSLLKDLPKTLWTFVE